jgi:hypothetical protein
MTSGHTYKAALHPIVSVSLYLILTHYVILSSLPYFYSFIIENILIKCEWRTLEIYHFCRSTTWFAIYILIVLFFCPFYKTDAFPEVPENGVFFSTVTKKMLSNKRFCLIILSIYFMVIYGFLLLISKNVISYYDFNENTPYPSDWIPILTVFDLFYIKSKFMPFSLISIFFYLAIYTNVGILLIDAEYLNFVLVPIKFHVWDKLIFKKRGYADRGDK